MTRVRVKKGILVAGLFALTGFLPAGQAEAEIEAMRARVPKIVELKEKGLIGEEPNGLLGVVKAEGDAESVVKAENADRMTEYGKRAKAQNEKVETLMKVLGEARIRQEKPGRYIKGPGGWTKK